MDIRSVTCRRLLTAEMPDLGAALDHAIAVRRTDLHRLLLESVGGVASVETRFGCVAVSADSSGLVRISSTGQNGPDLDLQELRADVIVGPDGASSAMRRTGGFQSRVSSGSSYTRTIVPGRASPWFEEYWTPLGSFGQSPLDGDQVSTRAEPPNRRPLTLRRRERRSESCRSASEISPLQDACVDLK
jgi:2-polyprenyl-6-methoxyphenol hydroxylase-like FAD-dependent oxidoreductase